MQAFFISLVIVLTHSTLSLGGENHADPAIEKFLPGYIALQEALAKDDLVATQQKVREILKTQGQWQGGELPKILDHLQKIDKAGKIADARKEFKGLSALVVEWLKKHPKPDLDIMYCPMAGARWVQKKGEPINPYMGREMLHCGEKAS